MNIEASWQNVLNTEIQKPYFKALQKFIDEEYSSTNRIYPPQNLVYNAFKMTPYHEVKVVIIGQDPYHGHGQAHGLCFSVTEGTPFPPSLKNIFKEMESDLGIPIPSKGDLSAWARQGVLLLNATLTVQEKDPMSHHGKGWEFFTDAVVSALIQREDPVIFVLWGKSAQNKCLKIKELAKYPQQFVLKAAHPSPFSAYQGFFGCRHFSKINALLELQGKTQIDWKIT